MKTSSDDTTIHQVTLRLPGDLHRLLRRTAKARRTSVNALLRQAIEELGRAEREVSLRRAYEVMGGSGAEVTPYFKAQAEVARRG